MFRNITYLLFSWLVFATSALADTYPGVLFDNSIMQGSYAHSYVNYQGTSWVENVQCNLPVSDTLFFTPGNALSLKYVSGQSGNWHADLSFPRRTGSYEATTQEALALKLFVLTDDTDASDLPSISLVLSDGGASTAVDVSRYIGSFSTNSWLSVRVPIGDFRTPLGDLSIEGIRLAQRHGDGDTHHVLVDQVEFLPLDPPSERLFSSAVLASVKAYDRHVKLTWELPMTPSIRYIKVYRSDDNETFEPVGIKPVFVRNAIDVVPVSNKSYYYKIAWVDYDYAESPFSSVKAAETKPASDDELLDFIQETHVNYFLENAEVNSGMHALSRRMGDPRVSVKHTGLGLLSQIVGVERGFVSRNLLANRTLRILRFLENAEQHHGVFPTTLNGRTGQGVHRSDMLHAVDVVATAYLIQGMLVAKQYFDGDTKEEVALRDNVDKLYKQVNWAEFVAMDGDDPFLLDSWSPVNGFTQAKPLGGFNEGFIGYILALASPTFPIPAESYAKGLGYVREAVDPDSTHFFELVNNAFFGSSLEDNSEEEGPVDEAYFLRTSISTDTIIYGLPIAVGAIDDSPMKAVLPFLAFDPREKLDTFANYFENNRNLLQAYKRRDNEIQVDDFSLDIWGSVYRVDTLGNQDVVINPAISLSTYPYQPHEALKSARAFYDRYGSHLFTGYGFRPWINPRNNMVSGRFDAISQAVVAVSIENGRSGLVWDLLAKDEYIAKVVARYFKKVTHHDQQKE